MSTQPARPQIEQQGKAGPVDVAQQQQAVAGAVGGSDNYPYVDKTAIPMHERVSGSLTEISQAESNPAFTPKPEDGGPVQPKTGAGIGTELNAAERAAIALEQAAKLEAAKQ